MSRKKLNLRKVIAIAICLAVSSAFVACKKDIPVRSVELDQKTATLVPGEVLKLKAVVKPSDATNNEVSWTSSNKSVATVSQSGVVTAIAVGTAVITVTTEDGNKEDDCIVTVTPEGGGGNEDIRVIGVELNLHTATLELGKTLELIATIKPSNATNSKVSWTSSNKSVATVSQGGIVTAIADGMRI